MVQVFLVLRCCSCQTFQVQQEKKAKKWNCKVCDKKQSVCKIYGNGSAVNCRKHVQKLNMMRGEKEQNTDIPPNDIVRRDYAIDDCTEPPLPQHHAEQQQQILGHQNIWSQFVEESGNYEEEDDENGQEENIEVTTDPQVFYQFKKRKKDTGKSAQGKRSKSGNEPKQVSLKSDAAVGDGNLDQNHYLTNSTFKKNFLRETHSQTSKENEKWNKFL